jgi:trehalose 6-phosphate synthase/phosphatase
MFLSEGMRPVELSTSIARGFYEGYANQTLWPLFHQFPSRIVFDSTGWEAYRTANQRFLEVLLEHLQPDDTIWIHDYHLMLLPQLIRQAVPEACIGFFLHTPFPSSEVFRVLPRREELLKGVLGADCIGFQTHSHLQHFRSSLLRILGVDSSMDRTHVVGRFVRLEALPIGIAPESFVSLLTGDAATAKHVASLRQRFRGRRLLLAVDRLDYTKGIPERLRAFRRLLERAPEMRGQIVLIQVAVPSRERVPSYQKLKHEVNEIVGSINGDFGTTEWTPVVYIRRALSRPELVALYACSQVGWVAPLRDGMNLVAKEYVACQQEGDGVLVLSEFAGAAAEMGEAFLVNPYDEERTSEVLATALTLPKEERHHRMKALRHRVLRNDAFTWARRFLDILSDSVEARGLSPVETPQTLRFQSAIESFRVAATRWILLDYDGIVALAEHPGRAAPGDDLLGDLAKLSAGQGCRVALISGGSRENLDRWFGHIASLTIFAEHGSVMRLAEQSEWLCIHPSLPADWKPRVRPILEHFVDRTPGSFVEERDYSLVWHYRKSEPGFGEWLANELVSTLEDLLADTDLRAKRGKKSVEVRSVWASKQAAVRRLAGLWPTPDFCLALGDDSADEDLFQALPERSCTVRVGPGSSIAHYSLPDSEGVRGLLTALVECLQSCAEVTEEEPANTHD